jgi:hypothetical protein
MLGLALMGNPLTRLAIVLSFLLASCAERPCCTCICQTPPPSARPSEPAPPLDKQKLKATVHDLTDAQKKLKSLQDSLAPKE